MKEVFASVVVPAYNCEKTIQKVIECLLNQTVQPKEIIIVDDGSTDQTATIIKQFPSVVYLHQSNSGPAKARNLGFYRTTAEVVFFTDSDCFVKSDWIAQGLEGFSQTKDIAVVCGSYGQANRGQWLADCIHDEIIFRHTHLLPDFPRMFGSYNFAILRNVFKRVGGFDSGFRYASGEDNLLSYEIGRTGMKIFFNRNMLVDHIHTTQVGKYLKEQGRHGYWRAKLYILHPSKMMGDDYTFWKDMLEVPMSFIVSILALFFLYSLNVSLLFGLCLIGFVLFETYFSLLICQNKFGKWLFGGIMMMRAFVRSFCFAWGCLVFFVLSKK